VRGKGRLHRIHAGSARANARWGAYGTCCSELGGPMQCSAVQRCVFALPLVRVCFWARQRAGQTRVGAAFSSLLRLFERPFRFPDARNPTAPPQLEPSPETGPKKADQAAKG